MRLVLISDIHDRPAAIPTGDCLILAGDIFCGDDTTSLKNDLAWIKSLGFKTVLAVLGNHDLVLTHLLKTQPETARGLLGSAGVTLLRDKETVVDGLRFYGVDWRSEAEIPSGNDVIISHCPPAGILDGGLGGPTLRRAIFAAKPRLHVFGHAHACRGHVILEGIEFYNATLDIQAPQLAIAASSHAVTLPTVEPWVVDLYNDFDTH
jgi:Icc-related predicted phosphoesterase